MNYRVGQKVTKFAIFSDPTRKLSALPPGLRRIRYYSKTTILLSSAKCTRPLFQGRTGCGGRPPGWHDIVTCQRLVVLEFKQIHVCTCMCASCMPTILGCCKWPTTYSLFCVLSNDCKHHVSLQGGSVSYYYGLVSCAATLSEIFIQIDYFLSSVNTAMLHVRYWYSNSVRLPDTFQYCIAMV